jgi:hypothetical protein
MNSVRAGIVSACLCLVSLAGSAQPSVGADTAPTVNAIWVEQDIEFTYMGFTSYYSCDGLRDKLRWVLQEIGARPGFQVRVSGCMDKGPDLIPRVRIKAAMLREATPELLARLAEDASRRELIARAAGKSAEVNEATAQLPARTRQVEFRDRVGSRIEDGECELVEQLRDKVFVPLGARVVEDQLSCVPKTVMHGDVRLTIEVLEPVPSQ